MQCDVSDSRGEDSEKPHGLNHVHLTKEDFGRHYQGVRKGNSWAY